MTSTHTTYKIGAIQCNVM